MDIGLANLRSTPASNIIAPEEPSLSSEEIQQLKIIQQTVSKKGKYESTSHNGNNGNGVKHPVIEEHLKLLKEQYIPSSTHGQVSIHLPLRYLSIYIYSYL